MRLLGWVTLFVIGTDLFVVSPLLPAITEDFDVSSAAAGTAVTAFALAYLIGGPTLGTIADRRGRMPVLLAALAVFAAANLATAAADAFPLLLASRAVAGLAASGITPSVYALISAASPPRERAKRLAVVTSGLLLALATGAPAGALLGAALGWRGAFLLLAAASGALLAVTAVAGRHAPSASAGPRPARIPLGGKLRSVAVTGLWACSLYGFYTYLGTILDVAGLDPVAGSVALVCFGVGAVAGNLAGGFLADHRGGRGVSIACLALLAVTTAAVAAALHAPTWVLFAALGALALAAYPYFPAQQSRLLVAFPQASGSLMAWNNSAMYAGILVGSSAGGAILTHAGATALALTSTGVAVVAIVAAATSIPSSLER